MSPIWHLRAFRLWFLLYLPAAIFFGYHALSSAIEIASGRRAVADWVKVQQQKVARGERKLIEPVDVQFEMLKTDFVRLYEHRNIALAFLIAGLSIPGLAILLKTVVGWVWASHKTFDATDSATDSTEKAAVTKYLRWYKWSSAAMTLLVVGLLFTPEKMAETAISALVQAIGLVVLVWVFMRIKEWWAWRQPQ